MWKKSEEDGRIQIDMQGGGRKRISLIGIFTLAMEIHFQTTAETQEDDERKRNVSHDELLQQPVYIQHRPKKDPRDLKILDPACGSGHFLLYGFDLLLTIYEEAYGDPDLGPVLRKDYPSLDELRRDVPNLILGRNLHGIDIDLRATQIAALALWLRCQRVYQEDGLHKNRPKITRSNIVCAEPMPGQTELLEGFVTDLQPKVLGQLIKVIVESMELAGEAGSLLKIEDEIAHTVSEAKKQWMDRPKAEQLALWTEEKRLQAEQLGLFDVSDITDEAFWREAEARVFEALHEYAWQATNGARFQRRLFAEDVIQGFAFVDLCRKRFDAVLMNPPFGDASLPSKSYIEENFCDTKGDVYKAFVECFHDRLVPRGFLGIISSRSGFFLRHSSDWRERILLRLYRPQLLADLGYGVLDAMVETAAYVLQTISEEEDRNLTFDILPGLRRIATDKRGAFSIPKYQSHRGGLKRHQAIQELRRLLDADYVTEVPGHFRRFMVIEDNVQYAPSPQPVQYPAFCCFRLQEDREKECALNDVLHHPHDPRYFVTSPNAFREISGAPFSYWVSERMQRLFTELPRFENKERMVKQGLATADDFRFVRAWWEVPSEQMLDSENGLDYREELPAFQEWCRQRTFEGKRWVPFAKGGAYSPYYADLYLVVNWERDGEEIRGFERAFIRNEGFYFRPGLTWPLRASGLSFRALPAGCIFGHKGPTAFSANNNPIALLPLLAVMNSNGFYKLVEMLVARVSLAQSFEVGLIQSIPTPDISSRQANCLKELVIGGLNLKRKLDNKNETNHIFTVPFILKNGKNSIDKCTEIYDRGIYKDRRNLEESQKKIDKIVYKLYEISEKEQQIAKISLNNKITTEDGKGVEASSEEHGSSEADFRSHVTDLVSYFFGTVLGRWDIRYVINQYFCFELPDPFSPLPLCPPGMLTDQIGLPTREVPPEYPIRIDWDGILVDDPDHQDDIIRRIRDVLELIWEDQAESIEKEACAIFGCKGLRDYFRKPGKGGFWDDHVKRYSKKPRKAPIYWLLQSSKKNYALWLYYHRLDKDILFKALVNYVEPKIQLEESRLEPLRTQRVTAGASGCGVKQLDKDIDRQEAFISELQDFEGKLRRAAEQHLDPDLNDGVVLNIAPLHELVPWKEAKKYWDELLDGKYEWSSIGKQLKEKGIVHGP